MDEKRMTEVFADEVFVKKLLSLQTPEAVQTALGEKGIKLSLQEVEAVGKALLKAVESANENGGELSIESLDEVAGGVMISQAAAQVVTRVVPVVLVALGGTAGAVASFLSRW